MPNYRDTKPVFGLGYQKLVNFVIIKILKSPLKRKRTGKRVNIPIIHTNSMQIPATYPIQALGYVNIPGYRKEPVRPCT